MAIVKFIIPVLLNKEGGGRMNCIDENLGLLDEQIEMKKIEEKSELFKAFEVVCSHIKSIKKEDEEEMK